MFANATRASRFPLKHPVSRRLKRPDPLLQGFTIGQCRMPKRGDIPVQLHEEGLLYQPLHHGRQGHNAATNERVNQDFRLGLGQPFSNVRD